MLIVEDQPDAGALVNPQHVGRRKADVVVFQHQSAPNVLGTLLPSLDPTGPARRVIIIDPTDMRDHHGLIVQLHAVEHLRLA